jgi:hypothetical protein
LFRYESQASSDPSAKVLDNPYFYIVSGAGSRTDSSEKHMNIDGEKLLYQ